jgi:Sec-independent protein translocase protein TatA
MNIFRLAAELFLIYLLYRLIFNFIIPIYQSTKKIKKQFGEMQSKMQSDMNAYQNQPKPQQQEPAKKKEGDYIEFEEVPQSQERN